MNIQDYFFNIPNLLEDTKNDVFDKEGYEAPTNGYLFTSYVLENISIYKKCDDYGCFEPSSATFRDTQGHVLGEIHGFMRICNNDDLYQLNLFYSIYNENADDGIKSLSSKEYNEAINRIKGFYTKALKDYHQVPSTAKHYALTKWICENEKQIKQINVCIITNSYVKEKTFNKNKDVDSRNILVRIGKDNIWDIDRIYGLLIDNSEREPINVDFQEEFGTRIPCVISNDNNKNYYSVLAILSGDMLFQLYDNYMDQLLESNVRLFLGVKKSKLTSRRKTRSVNEEIRKTLEENPSMFLAYNNGISATGIDAKIEQIPDSSYGYIKSINDFQIVNGGQTTVSIYRAKNDLNIDLSSVSIQMKLTIVSDPENLEDEITNISRCSNRQNQVKVTDFSANNKFNRKLEELFNKEYKENMLTHSLTRWYFDRKIGQYNQELNRQPTKTEKESFISKTPKSHVFKKELVAQLELAWDDKPYYTARQTSTCYSNFIDTNENTIPSLSYAQDLKSLLIIYHSIIENKSNTGNRKNLLAFYTMALLKTRFPKFSLYKIYKLQYVPDDLATELLVCSNAIRLFLYEKYDITDLRDKMNSEDCWNRVKNDSAINFNYEIISLYLKDSDEDRIRSAGEASISLPSIEDHDRVSHMGRRFWFWVSEHDDNVSSRIIQSIVSKMIKKQIYTNDEVRCALEVCDDYNSNKDKMHLFNEDSDNESMINEITENDSINMAWEIKNYNNDEWISILELWGNLSDRLPKDIKNNVANTIRSRIENGEFNKVKYDKLKGTYENLMYLKKFHRN